MGAVALMEIKRSAGRPARQDTKGTDDLALDSGRRLDRRCLAGRAGPLRLSRAARRGRLSDQWRSLGRSADPVAWRAYPIGG